MKEEKGRHIAAMKAFELAEKKSQDVNARLVEADRDKKSVEATLDGVERQAKAHAKPRTSSSLLEAKSKS